MKHFYRDVEVKATSLTANAVPIPYRLGRRDTRLVMHMRGLTSERDQHGLPFIPLDEVFTTPTTFIGFGRPNTYLVTPATDGASSDKLAAFMFWRNKAVVVPTKGRVQAGALFELLDLAPEAIARLRVSMQRVVGKRGASCAHQVALALAGAGFRLGNGKSLTHIYRPSRFASLLWRYGLQYTDTSGRMHAVQLRIIHANPGVAFDRHFRYGWNREITSPARTVQKQYTKHTEHQPAPLFAPNPAAAINADRWNGPEVVVGMAKSSFVGAHVAFLMGQKPTYIVKLPGLSKVPGLTEPLKPSPVKGWATRLKRWVLFSPVTVALINLFRVAGIDWYDEGITANMVLDMVEPSPGPEYDTAVLHNYVVTEDEIRVTSLHTSELEHQKSKLMRIIDWIAAKHVLLSRYSKHLRIAGELWAYLDDGMVVLCINPNSGSYVPTLERLEAFAEHLCSTLGVRVRVFPYNPGGNK